MKVKLQRWPWQENGRWNNNWMDRFGGGWKYKLGLSIGGKTVIIDLLFGIIRISW